jgi:hypothetical protein
MQSRDRRTSRAFKRAGEITPQNYSGDLIEKLADEIEALNATFKAQRLGLVIRGYWVESNLSYVAVLEDKRGHSLLKLQLTPLSRSKAQFISSVPKEDDTNQYKVGTRVYNHLDKEDCVERFLADIRKHLYAATPSQLKDSLIMVFNGVQADTEEGRELLAVLGSIPAKYQGVPDPHQAYAMAHQQIH